MSTGGGAGSVPDRTGQPNGLTPLVAPVRGLALLVLLVLSAVAIPAPAHAQPARFSGSTGLLSYTVEAERAEQFEALLQRILRAHTLAPMADAKLPPLDVRLLRGRTTPGWVVFVLLFERIAPGTDYSIEALIAALFPPGQADAVLREFTAAAKGAGRVALDLDLIRRLTPDETLRTRLELELGPLNPVGQGDSSTADLSQLEALQRPGFALDRLTFAVAQRGGDAWLQWTAAVRNTSPVESLRGRYIIEFHDAAGSRVAVSPPVAVALDALESRPVSGEIRMSIIDAGRVARATAAYTAQ